MKIHQKYSLKLLNTFGVEASSDYFVEVHSEEELKLAISELALITDDIFILGGGSNLLFTQNFSGGIIKINIKGIEIIQDDKNFVYVQVGSGENWHNFVMWAVENNFSGIENLSLIPGEVGAAPIQNIGAYGMEVKDVIEVVEVLEKKELKTIKFTNNQCKFSYRNSYFKSEGKGKFIITSVVFRLNKFPKINTSYGEIENELKKSTTPLSIKKVSDAVIAIRQRKLPDPNILGNSGSFFKNPIITKSHFYKIKSKYPNIIAFELPNDKVKIAAGWMIEELGWKSKKINGVGVHEKQALVIINYDNASGKDILDFAQNIQSDVQKNFNIALEAEVNIL